MVSLSLSFSFVTQLLLKAFEVLSFSDLLLSNGSDS